MTLILQGSEEVHAYSIFSHINGYSGICLHIQNCLTVKTIKFVILHSYIQIHENKAY